MLKKNIEIKKKLLKLYKKDNPTNPTNFKKQYKIYSDVFEKLLKFPFRFFKGLEVGDFACGTGEFALIAAKHGAKTTGYDFNPISINIAKKKAKILKIKKVKFFIKEFFKMKGKFDFVFCTAALHHLPNPYAGLKHLKSKVKKGGFLFLSFGLDSSNLQHNLMKLIVRNWGDKNIKKAAKYIFSDHIKRCVKYGLRSEDSVIADQFINSQHNFLNLQKVFNILNKNFVLHSSWPPPFIPRGDSAHNTTILKNDKSLFPTELYWSSKTLADSKRISNFSNENIYKNFKNLVKTFNHQPNKSINNFLDKNYKKIITKMNIKKVDFSFGINDHNVKFYNEFYKLLIFLKKKPNSSMSEIKKVISRNKYLFKETNGLGLNYFIFKNRSNLI